MLGRPCQTILKRFSIDDEKTKPCKHFIIRLLRNECCDNVYECSDFTLYCITLDFYTFLFTPNGKLFIIAAQPQTRHSIRSDHFCISKFHNTHVKIHNKTLSDHAVIHDDHTNIYQSEIQNGCRSTYTNIKPCETFDKYFCFCNKKPLHNFRNAPKCDLVINDVIKLKKF